jgi:hypothetical protein
MSRPSSTSVPATEVIIEQPEAPAPVAETSETLAPAPVAEKEADATPSPQAAQVSQADSVRTAAIQPNGVEGGVQFVSLPRTFEPGEVTGLTPADAAPAGAEAGEAIAPSGVAQAENGEMDPWQVGALAGVGGLLLGTVIWHDDLIDADDDDDDDDVVRVASPVYVRPRFIDNGYPTDVQ